MMLVVLMLDVLRSDGMGEDDEVFWVEPDSPEPFSLPVWGCAR